MKNLALSLLLATTLATPAMAEGYKTISVKRVPAAAMLNDDNVDGGRVRTPYFPGGPVELGGRVIDLSSKGEGCKFAQADGWFVVPLSSRNYYAGCWTQQGHIIKLDTHVAVYNGMQIENIKHDVVDVPDRFYN